MFVQHKTINLGKWQQSRELENGCLFKPVFSRHGNATTASYIYFKKQLTYSVVTLYVILFEIYRSICIKLRFPWDSQGFPMLKNCPSIGGYLSLLSKTSPDRETNKIDRGSVELDLLISSYSFIILFTLFLIYGMKYSIATAITSTGWIAHQRHEQNHC